MHRMGFGRRVAPAVALVLVAAGATACEGESPPPVQGLVYAALGDSYTAAPWIPKPSSEGCIRSDHNYPHLVARSLQDVRFADVSCGGATTESVLQSQVQADQVQPPQIDAVTAETDIVTVGLGANDLDFSTKAVLECVALTEHDPDGALCEDANDGKIPRLLERIQDRLVEVLDAIQDRAPDARILVVGYPHLLPHAGGCPKRLPLAKGDVHFVRESFESLIDTVEAAARKADVEYVDVATASQHHDICSPHPWINGADQKRRSKEGAPYHPTPAEQQAVAELILELL